MKYLYKYPQREFPYDDLVETNRRRTREELEYELLDTGVFDDDRYFDVFVEYAKAGAGRHPDPHHGPQPRAGGGAAAPAADALVPQHLVVGRGRAEAVAARGGAGSDRASHPRARRPTCCAATAAPELLFTENESNAAAALGQPNSVAVRQGRLPRLRHRRAARRRESRARPGPRPRRTTCSTSPGRRQRDDPPAARGRPAAGRRSAGFDEIFDEPARGRRRVLRADHAALAERGRAPRPPPGAGRHAVEQAVLLLRSRAVAQRAQERIRCSSRRSRACGTREWFHMLNADIISMPDKWEYPWYAAWDLAFHTIVAGAGRFRLRQGAAAADAAQPLLHPNGQIPAYEWNFSDVNPPVHAWATLFLYRMERTLGRGRHALPGARRSRA